MTRPSNVYTDEMLNFAAVQMRRRLLARAAVRFQMYGLRGHLLVTALESVRDRLKAAS